MDWYYSNENDKQVGPVSEEDISELVATGTVSSTTEVWAEGMNDWVPMKESDLASLLPASPPPRNSGPPPRHSKAETPKSQKVNPHLAWLNLLLPGIAQTVFRKRALGITLMVVTVGVFVIRLNSIAITRMLCGGELDWTVNGRIEVPLSITLLALTVLSIIDAYKTASSINEGRKVGPWQLHVFKSSSKDA